MRNKDFFKNKKVTIVGLARSGLACANLFYRLGAQVSVTEKQDNDLLRHNAAALASKEIRYELGRHSRDFIRGQDLVIVSPGVPDEASPVAWAKELNIPLISEIEAAWLVCPGKVIAVTGTSGKTTVTTLIGRLLEAAGIKAFVCGNIGIPFSQEVEKISAEDFVSLEVSSFQLEHISDFKPRISVLLNFSRNHLDRYKDMPEYLEAKKRIFLNQGPEDFLVYNHDDPLVTDAVAAARARLLPFCASDGINPNCAALSCVGEALGIDREVAPRVFNDFKGLPHRMEYVAEHNGVVFINDSKATTAESAVWALKSIDAPVILIAGGKDKGVDYSLILGAAAGKLKQVIVIGEAAEKIESALNRSFAVSRARSLEEAVEKALSLAAPGDRVLLSPMCSSFDMFSGYEERGACFKKAVQALGKASRVL